MAEDAEVVKATPSGLMVALKLQPELAAKVALPGGLPAAELHCTLAYCGRTEDLPADAQERARAAVAIVAAEFGPFVGVLGGVGRFNASGTSDGKDVLHATLDAPLLPPLREALVAALEKAGLPAKREHGFDPHITLRYEDPAAREQGAALPAMASMPAVFQALTVAAGETQVEVPLTGVRVVKAVAMGTCQIDHDALALGLVKAGADPSHLLKELTDAEREECDAETEAIRERRKTPEAQAPHPFKTAEWTHPNGHPRCALCGDEERTGGQCDGAAVTDALRKMADHYGELMKAGVSEPAARVRLAHLAFHVEPMFKGWEAGSAASMAVDLFKARTHSPEFLEEVYRQVREKCPPWVADAIRDSAKPRAGARARARRREDAAAAAPSVLELLALRGVQPAHLEDLDEPGIRGAWEKLRTWHGAAKRRAEPAEEVLGAARHFAAEFKRRKLALAEDDELVLASTLAGPGPGPGEGARVAKLLKARSRAEKQIVYGVVLDPYRVDAHNDWPPPADVEATAHGWLEKYRDVPLWHLNDKGYRPMAAVPVESWLEAYPSPEDYAAAMKGEPHTVWRRQFGSDMVHSGTWIIGVRLPDDLWAAYQRGEIDAFSIQGFGMKRPATRAEMPKVTVIDLVEAR